MKITVVVSRKAEIYSGNLPLAWFVRPLTSRFDRKRSAFTFEVPEGSVFSLYDGKTVAEIVCRGTQQLLKFKMAQLEGNLFSEQALKDEVAIDLT